MQFQPSRPSLWLVVLAPKVIREDSNWLKYLRRFSHFGNYNLVSCMIIDIKRRVFQSGYSKDPKSNISHEKSTPKIHFKQKHTDTHNKNMCYTNYDTSPLGVKLWLAFFLKVWCNIFGGRSVNGQLIQALPHRGSLRRLDLAIRSIQIDVKWPCRDLYLLFSMVNNIQSVTFLLKSSMVKVMFKC